MAEGAVGREESWEEAALKVSESHERHLPALPALPLLQPAVPSCSSVSQACSHLGAPALALPFCLECISSHIYIVPRLTPFRCLLKSNFL